MGQAKSKNEYTKLKDTPEESASLRGNTTQNKSGSSNSGGCNAMDLGCFCAIISHLLK